MGNLAFVHGIAIEVKRGDVISPNEDLFVNFSRFCIIEPNLKP